MLENHHAATTFRLLSDKHNNILGGLKVKERVEVRGLVCKSILATDMAHHSELVNQLTEMTGEAQTIDVGDVLKAFLHLADLSNSVLMCIVASNPYSPTRGI